MRVDMPVKEVPAAEIILGDRTCQGTEASRVFDVIEYRLNQGNSLLIRKHNSLYLVTKLAVGEAEAHFYTIDSAIYAVKALKYFLEQTRDSGIHTLYVYDFSDPSMERMLNMLKFDVQPSDKFGFKHMINLGRSM